MQVYFYAGHKVNYFQKDRKTELKHNMTIADGAHAMEK